jgi:hypothetical protein
LLEGFYHWITCVETNVDAAIRKQSLPGLRLTLALAMAHEHLMRFDKITVCNSRMSLRMVYRVALPVAS